MKRVLRFVLIGALLITGMAIGGFYWLEKQWLPARLSHFSLLGAPVATQGSPTLAFFPLRLQLKGLSWQNSSGGMRLNLIAESCEILPNIGDYLNGGSEFLEIRLFRPHLSAQEKNREKNAPPAEAPPEINFVANPIHALVIREGSFTFSDADMRCEGTGWNISFTNIRSRQQMLLQCQGGAQMDFGSSSISGYWDITSPMRYYAPNMTFDDATVQFIPAEHGHWQMIAPLKFRMAGAVNMRDGSLRIGSAEAKNALFQAQLSGTLASRAFQGHLRADFGGETQAEPFIVDGDIFINPKNMRLENASFSKSGLNAMGKGQINFVDLGKLAELQLQWADGAVESSLEWNGKTFVLDATGKDIVLGEVLDQMGIHGLSGCPSQMAAQFTFSGADAIAMRKSVNGRGEMRCRGLALEPFGELALLLPLLGKDLRFPDLLENVQISFSGKNGLFIIKPMTARGKGINCQGEAEVNLADSSINGQAEAKILDFTIPVRFSGPLDNVDVRINAK